MIGDLTPYTTCYEYSYDHLRREVAATLSKLNIVAQHESVAFESVKFLLILIMLSFSIAYIKFLTRKYQEINLTPLHRRPKLARRSNGMLLRSLQEFKILFGIPFDRRATLGRQWCGATIDLLVSIYSSTIFP
jgi:hypothetical protein